MPRSAAIVLTVAAALALLGFAASSAANTPAASPEWVSKPTASVIEHYYPVRAKLNSLNGKASMRCSVTPTGALESCRVLSETPKPYGFGASLLSMAQFFRMKPHDANGNPVAGMDVTVQLSFYMK
jgi:protein TonB